MTLHATVFTYLQFKCPNTTIPAPTEQQKTFCFGDASELQVSIGASQGKHFEACMPVAMHTECKDSVLESASGSQALPDWCLKTTETIDKMSFECSDKAAADAPPQQVKCVITGQSATCSDGLPCTAQPWVRCSDAAFAMNAFSCLAATALMPCTSTQRRKVHELPEVPRPLC
jgi:hypothetical protein